MQRTRELLIIFSTIWLPIEYWPLGYPNRSILWDVYHAVRLNRRSPPYRGCLSCPSFSPFSSQVIMKEAIVRKGRCPRPFDFRTDGLVANPPTPDTLQAPRSTSSTPRSPRPRGARSSSRWPSADRTPRTGKWPSGSAWRATRAMTWRAWFTKSGPTCTSSRRVRRPVQDEPGRVADGDGDGGRRAGVANVGTMVSR